MGCVWVAGHVPALLFFTISHKKKIEQTQPPSKLQFHDEEVELDKAMNTQLHIAGMNFLNGNNSHLQRKSIFIIEGTLPNQIIIP